MQIKRKYSVIIILAICAIVLLLVLGLDDDQTVINGVRHFLKSLKRAL